MDIKNLIKTGDFCEITTDQFIHEDVKRGQLVYVAGAKAFPITEEDPYTQRIKLYVHRLVDEVVQTQNLYLMDPASVTKASKSRQKKLTKKLFEQVKEQLVESIN